jgi:SAM-dependent methyltransferase
MNERVYGGRELERFARARRWKRYWSSQLGPRVRGAVLEVGAGLGANTPWLRKGGEPRWVCLEPDPSLAEGLRAQLRDWPQAETIEARVGTLQSLAATERFDTILYLDVLEHIEDDHAEVQRATAHLNPGGCLIVLAPAHLWLYSPFDEGVGHYRRYTLARLQALTAPGLRWARGFYLDSVGLLASAANRLLLRQSMPTAAQLAFWDRWMVPCSRVLDPLTGRRLGKSVAALWERTA